eukprot:jgi/Mesvir1/18742/Mv01251-RA.1
MRFASSLRRSFADITSRIPNFFLLEECAVLSRTRALEKPAKRAYVRMAGHLQFSAAICTLRFADVLTSSHSGNTRIKLAEEQLGAYPCKLPVSSGKGACRLTSGPNCWPLLQSTCLRAAHTRASPRKARNVSPSAVSNNTQGKAVKQNVEDSTQQRPSTEESLASPQGSDVEDDDDVDGEEEAGISLPQASGVRVKSAEFISSVVKREDCPPEKYPEFAVIGRSNVGKSSLINMLTGRKSLAMVSKTPGKTQTINHFLVNKEWYLVDLPGYGYAKTAPKSNQFQWNQFTKDYFLNRGTLVVVLLLVDSSIPPQEIDLKCAKWLTSNDVPFIIVFTKADKRKKGSTRVENIEDFMDFVRVEWTEPPPHFVTSSEKGIGKQEVLTHIAQLRNFWLKG